MAQGRQRHRLQGRKLALPARLLLLAVLGAPLPAFADASKGLQLMQENRALEAREEFEKGAALGETDSAAMLTLFLWYGYDRPPERSKACQQAAAPSLAKEPMAQAVLAHCHLTGTAVRKNPLTARALARPGALGGNNEARYAYYLSVAAVRPNNDRAVEVEAVDMLARAAQTGHRDSILALADYFFETVGEGNRGRAGALYEQIPGLTETSRTRLQLARSERMARSSPLTVKVVRDAQPSGALAARDVAYGTGPRPDCKDVRLLSTATAGPIEGAVYLPHTHPWVERSYLVVGHWVEEWHYEVCGRPAVVRMRFDADGLTGVRFNAIGGN